VPLPATRRHRVFVLTYGDENSRDVGAGIVASWRTAFDTLHTMRLWPASGPASLDSARAEAAAAGLVVFLAASRPTAWHPDAVDIPGPVADLVQQIAGAEPVVAVSLGSPYVLGQIPGVSAFVAAWTDNDAIERAVARALLGMSPVTGHLPVSLPPAFPAGSGLQRAGPADAPAAGLRSRSAP